MKQKNYKEIANIIRYSITKDWLGISNSDLIVETEEKLKKDISNKLADYFEDNSTSCKVTGGIKLDFNRQKFLKDCGVK